MTIYITKAKKGITLIETSKGKGVKEKQMTYAVLEKERLVCDFNNAIAQFLGQKATLLTQNEKGDIVLRHIILGHQQRSSVSKIVVFFKMESWVKESAFIFDPEKSFALAEGWQTISNIYKTSKGFYRFKIQPDFNFAKNTLKKIIFFL